MFWIAKAEWLIWVSAVIVILGVLGLILFADNGGALAIGLLGGYGLVLSVWIFFVPWAKTKRKD